MKQQAGKVNFCVQCGHQNPVRNNFCSKCGQRMYAQAPAGTAKKDIVKCPNCGHPNASAARFCAACSAPLVEDFKLVKDDDFVLVQINLPQIDFENHKDLNTLTKRIKHDRVLMDMSHVNWIDSTGIGALVTLCNRFARTQQDIKFYGVTEKVLEAFKALQVDNILEIYDDMNEALVTWGLPPR